MNLLSPLQTFSRWVCLVSLCLISRSTPPRSPIRTLQLVDWTCLQRAICLSTRWNWCPHLPEAINSKYDSLRSCATILLPAEYNKAELRRSWRGGGKPACGPKRVMGNYFRQIYTGSHAEWWTTVFDPQRQGKQQRFSAALGQLEWGRWGAEQKGAGGQLVAWREGHVINWRSSSGSFSIVGVIGQMSAVLMALLDARLTPPARPRLWLQDEAVTQQRERQKDEKIKRLGHGGERILWIQNPCLSTDISIKLPSPVSRILLTS